MNSSTAEARAMQREEFGQFIHGAFASLKSTIDVIGGALETVGLIFSSDSAKRQEGISRVKEFGGNIWYTVNHPIKTMEALGSQIAYMAETEGTSYLMGLGVGELSRIFSEKIVIKGVKNAKATKAADKAADVIKLKYVPSYGIEIVNDSKRTVTILGRYDKDIKYIIEELNIPKNTNFSGNK